MIEREEKEGVDRLIRFRELKRLYCHRVCVSGRQEEKEQSLPPSFSVLSLYFL